MSCYISFLQNLFFINIYIYIHLFSLRENKSQEGFLGQKFSSFYLKYPVPLSAHLPAQAPILVSDILVPGEPLGTLIFWSPFYSKNALGAAPNNGYRLLGNYP